MARKPTSYLTDVSRIVLGVFVLVILAACQTESPENSAMYAEAAASQARSNERSRELEQSRKRYNAAAKLEIKKHSQELSEDLDATHRNRDAVREGVEALSRLSTEQCKSGTWNSMTAAVVEIERIASKYMASVDQGYRASRSNLEIFRYNSEGAIGARFEIADTALRLGCLEIADANYRYILAKYVGSAYAGQRDRAKIGIDDVRQQKGSK